MSKRIAGVSSLCLLVVGILPSTGLAQVQRSIANSGFEQPSLVAQNNTNGCWRQVADTAVPGWNTTHPSQAGGGNCLSPGPSTGRLLEMWRTNFNGVAARSGNNFVELNAEAPSRLYQNVCLVNGETIRWRFSHRGRGSATIPDVMDYNIGAGQRIVRVGTTSTGNFQPPVATQGTVNAVGNGGNGWRDYSGVFTYGGATGITSMGFESISTANGSNTVGNFLDNIQIDLHPFVEFVQASSSTSEASSLNRPTLRVNGTVFAAFDVTVAITGGTATLGSDYTTPGNSSTLTVHVPVGEYDGASSASLFPLPVTIVQDALIEGNETIEFHIQAPAGDPPPFMLKSNMVCGAPAQEHATYTIVDDDSGLSITKNAGLPTAVPGSPAQFDIEYTINVANPSPSLAINYALEDVHGLDADASILSASYSRNGGAITPLAGSSPWTLQPQWRQLAANATDSYVLRVRFEVQRGGSTGNDRCDASGTAGMGLYNAAIATLRGTGGAGNATFSASACRDTPTPVWATLNKSVATRAFNGDQFEVRMLGAGNVVASASTSGSATSASTGVQVLAAGNTLQFEEVFTPASRAGSYTSGISCSNAATGSATVLPGGAGTDVDGRRQWPEFTTSAGDDITCTITNSAQPAGLVITKTNTPGSNGNRDQADDTLVSGSNTVYTLTVSNNGPGPSHGAILRDTAESGLTCTTATCTGASGGASCPAPTGAALWTALSGPGATIPQLPAGGSVSVEVSCTVQ